MLPSLYPSTTPSAKPSSTLSTPPTLIPSTTPSTIPSTQPSSSPTTIPSEVPTEKPSSKPSYPPTPSPTKSPIDQPSDIPSSAPTPTPSKSPTEKPSSRPSYPPTPSPTKSHTPTDIPTPSPTEAPTEKPTGAPTSSPSTPPTKEPTTKPINDFLDCRNNPTFKYRGRRSCRWFESSTETRRVNMCGITEVATNCPVTCGVCCKDSDTFTFIENSQNFSCADISLASASVSCIKWSSNMMVKDACPIACNSCRSRAITVNPSVPPTELPTSEDSDNTPCLDDHTYLYNDKSCKFIGFRTKETRDKLCEITEVLSKCPMTCGKCCEDDPEYSFLVGSDSVGCDWFSTSPVGNHCESYSNGRKVARACPNSCGICGDR